MKIEYFDFTSSKSGYISMQHFTSFGKLTNGVKIGCWKIFLSDKKKLITKEYYV